MNFLFNIQRHLLTQIQTCDGALILDVAVL